MPDWATTLLIFAGVVGVWGIADFRWPCRCGRTRPWYYGLAHEAGGLMAAHAGWLWVGTVIMVFAYSPVWALITVVFAVYHTRRWWLHEKDRIRRWAARAAGRVVIDTQRRRLKVEQTTGAAS